MVYVTKSLSKRLCVIYTNCNNELNITCTLKKKAYKSVHTHISIRPALLPLSWPIRTLESDFEFPPKDRNVSK